MLYDTVLCWCEYSVVVSLMHTHLVLSHPNKEILQFLKCVRKIIPKYFGFWYEGTMMTYKNKAKK